MPTTRSQRFAGVLPEKYEAAMARLDYGSALEAAWDLIKDANRYIEQEAPWNLAKSEETWPRLETVLYNALEAVRIAALFSRAGDAADERRGVASARSRRHPRGDRHRDRGARGGSCR